MIQFWINCHAFRHVFCLNLLCFVFYMGKFCPPSFFGHILVPAIFYEAIFVPAKQKVWPPLVWNIWYQTFYYLSSKLLVPYLRHGLYKQTIKQTNCFGPLEYWTVQRNLFHIQMVQKSLDTKWSIWIREEWMPSCFLMYWSSILMVNLVHRT